MVRRFRRAMYALRFPMALVLPLWVLLGFALWGGGTAGGLVGAILLVPVVVAGELGLSLLFSSRTAVRRSHLLEPRDAALLAVFQLAVIGFGFFSAAGPWFGLVAVAAALVGLWFGTRRLADDVRQQTRRIFGVVNPQQNPDRAPIDAGEYVVVKPAKR